MDLKEVLESVPLTELLETIQKKAKEGNKDVCSYIRAIFQGSADRSDEAEKRRFETFKCSLLILQTDLSHNITSEIVSLLLLKVDSFCTSNLMKIAEFFVEQVQTSSNLGTKWLEIFTKVLSCLSHRDSIVYQGNDMSGTELRRNIVSSLFSEDLSVSCVVKIISVLKDIDLSDEEMKPVAENLLKLLQDVESDELPPFIYQLLLLSAKGQCQRILQGVMSYFIKEDSRLQGNRQDNCLIENEGEIQFRQMEGTVAFLMSVTSSQDQGIGKEFSTLFKKMLHKPELVLSPFTFAAALLLSKVQSNKGDLFESLKKSLTVAYQLSKKKKNSLWMREMMPSSPDILDLVKEAIKCSEFGWDHVCQGLVKFGFSVVDTFGPKNVAGNVSKAVSEDGCILGCHILRDTFKSHSTVRSDILDELLNRIVTKSQKPVKHYIDILSQLVQKDPLFLLEVLPKLVEILDYIHFLPHKNAVDILQALAPLLRISMPLKDTLMLVLRKALFHRDVEARKVAVSGYLMILKKLNSIGKVCLSQSQTSMSSQSSSASLISTQIRADVYVSAGNPSSKTMCLEIMGLLKRGLIQQGSVRELLYEGLYDVTLQNKALREIVLELLLGQFELYYVSDEDADSPLQFSTCVKEQKGTMVLEEPLAHLITCIHLIIQDAGDILDDDDYDVSAQKILDENLLSLMKRLCKANAADLQIHKKDTESADVDIQSGLVLNVYESLLEYSLMQIKDYHIEGCEDLLKLYYRYKDNYEAVIDKKKKKTAKTKVNTTFPPMHVSIRFFATIMEGLYMDGTFKHQQGLNLLRSDAAFVMHMIKSCNWKLAKLSETGSDDGFSEVMNMFDLLLKITRLYFKTYNEGLHFNFSSVEWETMSPHFADGLASIFTYISAFQSKNAEKFIVGICNDASFSTSQAVQIVLKTIQKSVMKLLADTDNDLNLKETVPLLSVIRIVCDLFTEDIGEDLFKWLKQLCTQQVFQNTSVAKSFVSLCLTLGHQNKHIVTLLRELAFDIHYHLDDIDPEATVRGSTKYNILTAEVARNVIHNLISNSEILLDEVESVLNFLKSNISIPAELLSLSNSNGITQETTEGGVSSRLSDLISVFHEMLQTSVPLDHISGGIFKLVSKFYRILGGLTKYYLLLHIKSKTAELHPNFEKLVKLSHTKMTTQVYAFISYIQMTSEGGGKKKGKNHIAAQKAMRDIKTVPQIVFAIESYEKNLIVLSKKYNRNLVNHMKSSTARDFRINPNVITSTLQQSQESEADNSAAQNDGNEDDDNQSDKDDETLRNTSEPDVNTNNKHNSSTSNDKHNSSTSSDKRSTSDKSTRSDRSTRNVTIASRLSRNVSTINRSVRRDVTIDNGQANKEVLNDDANMDLDEKENDTSERKTLAVKRKRLGVRGNTKKAK